MTSPIINPMSFCESIKEGSFPMTEEKEFGFEEESTDPQEDPFAPPEEGAPGPAPASSKGSRTSPLLLVLLLVALGGAGYFYLFGTGEASPPRPHAVKVKKQPIAVPPKPQAPLKPVVAKAPAETPATPAAPVSAPVSASTSTPAPVAKTEASSDNNPQKAAPAPTPPAGSKQPAKAAVPAPAAPPAVAAKSDSVPGPGNYTVDAGAILLPSNLKEVERTLGKLGFEPRLSEMKKSEHMTRLRVGAFPPAQARAKLPQINRIAPGSFLVAEGKQLVLYAGSYYTLDKARIVADRLFVKGVEVKEEPVEVPLSLHLVSFGDFTDLDSARNAAERARAAGLEVAVRKVR